MFAVCNIARVPISMKIYEKYLIATDIVNLRTFKHNWKVFVLYCIIATFNNFSKKLMYSFFIVQIFEPIAIRIISFSKVVPKRQKTFSPCWAGSFNGRTQIAKQVCQPVGANLVPFSCRHKEALFSSFYPPCNTWKHEKINLPLITSDWLKCNLKHLISFDDNVEAFHFFFHIEHNAECSVWYNIQS